MKKTVINAFCFFIAVLSGICLFILKYQVKEEERSLQKIHREILQNKREIHMLEAEWAYLNDPQRLLELVTTQTNWETISSKQISTLYDIPLRPKLLPAAPEIIETEEKTKTPEKPVVIKEIIPITTESAEKAVQTESKQAFKEMKNKEKKKTMPDKTTAQQQSKQKGAVIGGVWKPASKSVPAQKLSAFSKSDPINSVKQIQDSASAAIHKGTAALSTLFSQKEKR